MQAEFVDNRDHLILSLFTISGEGKLDLEVHADEELSSIRWRILQQLRIPDAKLKVILPDGQLLSQVILEDPLYKVCALQPAHVRLRAL